MLNIYLKEKKKTFSAIYRNVLDSLIFSLKGKLVGCQNEVGRVMIREK